jgi:hypothetical protein
VSSVKTIGTNVDRRELRGVRGFSIPPILASFLVTDSRIISEFVGP